MFPVLLREMPGQQSEYTYCYAPLFYDVLLETVGNGEKTFAL